MTPDPLFDFSGKVVLITGGSRGLGLEMVLRCPGNFGRTPHGP